MGLIGRADVGAKLFLAPVGNARHSEKCITFLEHEILLNFFVSEHVKMAMPFFVQEKHRFSLHDQKPELLTCVKAGAHFSLSRSFRTTILAASAKHAQALLFAPTLFVRKLF